MKLYHFGLLFFAVFLSFFVTYQAMSVRKMQRLEQEKTEYDVLVASVNAMAEVLFTNGRDTVSPNLLDYGAEVFFQTMGVLQEGNTDRATREKISALVPCLVVFSKDGYYRYGRMPGVGYGWSDMVSYTDGKIPEQFYKDTEEQLEQYHYETTKASNNLRVEQATEGVWEQCLTPMCVFAVYAPEVSAFSEETCRFLYAATGYAEQEYWVTEDNYCHIPSCEKCKEGMVVAWYGTQKESAEEGAVPCEECLK